MIYLNKVKISEVPRADRKKLCKECRFYGCSGKCFMCFAIPDGVLKKWLDSIQHRFLYILINDKLPTRKTKCPWCDGSFTEEHLRVCHGRDKTDAWLLDTQQKTWAETRQVRRSGRWWGLPATFGQCQRCPTPSGRTCSLGVSAVTNVRCVIGLGLNPREMCRDLISCEIGFIIA
jgi:hypothetical protein